MQTTPGVSPVTGADEALVGTSTWLVESLVDVAEDDAWTGFCDVGAALVELEATLVELEAGLVQLVAVFVLVLAPPRTGARTVLALEALEDGTVTDGTTSVALVVVTG